MLFGFADKWHLIIINLYYLVKIYGRNEAFDVLEFKGEEKLVDKFIHFLPG